MANTKVVWTTDAISTLRHRDRFSQINILQDFEKEIATTDDPTKKAQKIEGDERMYSTRVLQGTYSVFWRWCPAPEQDSNRAEVVAVGEQSLKDAPAVQKLIQAESLAKEFV